MTGEQEKPKQRKTNQSNIDDDIVSAIITNTSQYKGINFTKLKQKTLHEINKEEHRQYFDCEKEQMIEMYTLKLIATGILNAMGGYIFLAHKIRIGDHIPSVVKYELQLYKVLYKEYPIENGWG